MTWLTQCARETLGLPGEIALDVPYDGQYEGVYKDRQYASATALYDSLGIAREQKAERIG